jgi:multiple antibiotic resistance protein
MLDFAEYVKIFVALLVIVNPIGTMPMFLGLTQMHSIADKKRIAIVASIAAASSASPSPRSRSAERSSYF